MDDLDPSPVRPADGDPALAAELDPLTARLNRVVADLRLEAEPIERSEVIGHELQDRQGLRSLGGARLRVGRRGPDHRRLSGSERAPAKQGDHQA